MADANGKNPGDVGYDNKTETDPKNKIDVKSLMPGGGGTAANDAAIQAEVDKRAALVDEGSIFSYGGKNYISKGGKGVVAPATRVSGSADWHQDSNKADGTSWFTRTNPDTGKPEYLGDNGPTSDFSAAKIYQKNVSEQKQISMPGYVAGKAYVIQDPSKGGATLYLKADGTYTTDINDPNIKVDGPADEAVTTGPNAGMTKHTDAKTGKITFSQGDGSSSGPPVKVPSNPAETQPGTGSVTPGQAAATTLPLDVAKLKQELQGKLATTLNQYAAAMKAGTLPLDDGLRLMEQATQEAAGNFLDASQRATAIGNFNTAKITEANNESTNNRDLLNNTLTSANDAAQHGSSAAGPLANSILANAGNINKTAQIQSPLEAMGVDPQSGLSMNFVQRAKVLQPVTDQHVQEVKDLINGGQTPQDAVVQIAKKYGILPQDFGTDTPTPTTPPPAPVPGGEADTGDHNKGII